MWVRTTGSHCFFNSLLRSTKASAKSTSRSIRSGATVVWIGTAGALGHHIARMDESGRWPLARGDG